MNVLKNANESVNESANKNANKCAICSSNKILKCAYKVLKVTKKVLAYR